MTARSLRRAAERQQFESQKHSLSRRQFESQNGRHDDFEWKNTLSLNREFESQTQSSTFLVTTP